MQLYDIELIFSNAMHQLDAGDRNGRIPKAFEAEHRVDTGFKVATIVLDKLFKCLDDRNVVSSSTNSAVFISRTAR